MLWTAESKTHGCDTNSSRCTQLLTDTVLAVEHDRMAVIEQRMLGNFAQSEQELGRRASSFGTGQRAREGRITDGTVSITDGRRCL